MTAAAAALDATTLPDEALLTACQAAAKADVSGRAAAAFIAAVLQPRVVALEQPASRTLFSALLALLAAHPRPMLDELVVPSLRRGSSHAMSAAQAEALTRLLKELPQPLLGAALSGFLAEAEADHGDTGSSNGWSEAQVAVLQTLLTRKPTLDAACIAALLVQADANVEALRKSLKFASLLNTLVRSHGPQLRPHVQEVRRIAERLESFMKKSILAAVAKL